MGKLGGKRGRVEKGRFPICNEEQNAVHLLLKRDEANETQRWREQFVDIKWQKIAYRK
jgi:hypothetical protein